MADDSVIIVIADGLGTDALDRAVHNGEVPALARLRDDGGQHVLTTSFPSVTGVAYVPMLTGRFPGGAGVPGLRWYDRERRLPRWLGHSRS
jgi:predicted AlkP superfamily pyrophosphatase or phosphodiesterase